MLWCTEDPDRCRNYHESVEELIQAAVREANDQAFCYGLRIRNRIRKHFEMLEAKGDSENDEEQDDDELDQDSVYRQEDAIDDVVIQFVRSTCHEKSTEDVGELENFRDFVALVDGHRNPGAPDLSWKVGMSKLMHASVPRILQLYYCAMEIGRAEDKPIVTAWLAIAEEIWQVAGRLREPANSLLNNQSINRRRRWIG
ncbi:hypothetical protein TI39_contig5928g00002 [Zymoseptoria brevis]|uniref:Uncharacterized protein n=1 Tax=Zymoseptoria brevis TaxID=1047168 RepID=A0A0F4G4V8_9PEZI|nr:hypothetical protein TI39_contig5928g00002 [Zymoseptoria brevis]